MQQKQGKGTKLGGNIVFNLVLFGVVGQIAWAVENMYFNTFLFNYIGGTTRDISRMVALSAVTAVLTTFFMGTLSDRWNRRKEFIAVGYIAWGLTVIAFSGISRENVAELFSLQNEAQIVSITVGMVILMDCLMTFMGSTSNDAAFNAWITDITVPENRGKTEGLLSIFPILAQVVVMAGFGLLVDRSGYPAFFLGLGIVVSVCGIIGAFSIKESRSKQRQGGNYWAELVYGFRPSVIRENARLYWTLLAAGISSIGMQVFFPYLFIYVQHFLGLGGGNSTEANAGLAVTPGLIVLGVIVVAALIALAIGVGTMLDRLGKRAFLIPAAGLMLVGLAGAFLVRNIIAFLLLMLLYLAGMSLMAMILNAKARDYTPEDKVGQFQGVRMVFYVLLPMVIGPAIGNAVIDQFSGRHDAGSYLNEYGELVQVPVPEVFLTAALILLLIFIPIFFVRKYMKEEKATESVSVERA